LPTGARSEAGEVGLQALAGAAFAGEQLLDAAGQLLAVPGDDLGRHFPDPQPGQEGVDPAQLVVDGGKLVRVNPSVA
jgi:hypothetical protein